MKTNKGYPIIARGAYGELRLMAIAENYAMVRRPGCMPTIMPLESWRALCGMTSILASPGQPNASPRASPSEARSDGLPNAQPPNRPTLR